MVTLSSDLLITLSQFHHKFAIVDSEIVVTGSYNWTKMADSSNYENLVMLKHKRTVAYFEKEFDKILKIAKDWGKSSD